jgi:hypothetical protein
MVNPDCRNNMAIYPGSTSIEPADALFGLTTPTPSGSRQGAGPPHSEVVWQQFERNLGVGRSLSGIYEAIFDAAFGLILDAAGAALGLFLTGRLVCQPQAEPAACPAAPGTTWRLEIWPPQPSPTANP